MAAPNADHGDGPDDDAPERPEPDPADDPGLDVDARWADIVAGLSDLSGLDADRTGGQDPRPAGPTASGRKGPGDAMDAFPRAPWVRETGPRDWPTTPEVEALEEAESHFVPPDPTLDLGRDPLLTMAWALVVGAPLVLLVILVLVRPFPALVAQVGIGAFAVGLAVLIWRMPHRRDADDHDPGAVV